MPASMSGVGSPPGRRDATDGFSRDYGDFEVAQSGENWFVEAPGDIHRIEACLTGAAYAPHRHDTYTIGITLSGIQSFTDFHGRLVEILGELGKRPRARGGSSQSASASTQAGKRCRMAVKEPMSSRIRWSGDGF